MNRKHRLTSSTDFKRVRRTGQSYAHPFLVLVVAPKRRMRASLQQYFNNVKHGWDIILIARPAILKAPWQQLVRSLGQLLKRAELLDDHE